MEEEEEEGREEGGKEKERGRRKSNNPTMTRWGTMTTSAVTARRKGDPRHYVEGKCFGSTKSCIRSTLLSFSETLVVLEGKIICSKQILTFIRNAHVFERKLFSKQLMNFPVEI